MGLRLVPPFEEAMRRALRSRGIVVSRWTGSSRASSNLLELSTAPRPTVLYVKESTSRPGFWGLTKNQIDSLEHTGALWHGIFLHHSAAAGYLLSGNEIGLRIGKRRIRLAGDGDYKLNEHDQFLKANRFEQVAELVQRLLDQQPLAG